MLSVRGCHIVGLSSLKLTGYFIAHFWSAVYDTISRAIKLLMRESGLGETTANIKNKVPFFIYAAIASVAFL
jgi:hypothetical protein